MVILGALLLIGLIAGIWWLASMAWGRRGRGWPGDGPLRSLPLWPLAVLAAAGIVGLVVLLRGRGFPLLLLLIPLGLRIRRGRDRPRCPSCGEPVSPEAVACFACGASRG